MNFDQVREWGKTNSRRIMLAGVGLALVGVGVFWLKTGDTAAGVEILPTQEEVMVSSSGAELIVDVAGAVNRPGVYSLAGGSRVNDALAAAGGLGENADVKWVETILNRSAKLADGMKIYIPHLDEKTNSQSSGSSVSGKTNINTASTSELDVLPGVGPVTAGKIISGRPYARAEELVQRKIVSQKVWEQIKEQVATW